MEVNQYYKTVKTSLRSIVKDDVVCEKINNCVKTSNRIVIKTYLFLRLLTLHNYHNKIVNPIIDNDFVDYCIRTVSIRKDKRGIKDSKNLELKNMLNEFYEQEFKPLLPLNEEIETYTGMTFILPYLAEQISSVIKTNIKEHYVTRLKRYLNIIHGVKFREKLEKERDSKIRKEIRKEQWEHIHGILKDLCTNSLNNSHRIYHKWILENRDHLVPKKLEKDSLYYDIACENNTFNYVNYGYYINEQIEKLSTEEKPYKLFQPFSLRTSVTPKYIKIDNSCIVNLFATGNKSLLLKAHKKDPIQERKKNHQLNNLWNTLFKTEKKVFNSVNGFQFTRSFCTDGISVSLLFIRNDIASLSKAKRSKYQSTERDWYNLNDLNKHQLEHLKCKKVVGVDPGKSNLVYLVDGNKTLRYTAMQKRYESGNKYYNKLLKSDKEKNGVHKLENELSEYTCKTSGYDKYKDFIAKKMIINCKIRKYYERAYHRKYRFKKYIRTCKSYDKFLNKIEEVFGDDPILGYGNWSRKSQMKGHIPTIGKGLRKVISKRFTNITVDEYNTSKICYNCHCETEKLRVRNKKVHRLLSCKSKDCKTIWNRDLNGGLNIMNLMKCFLHTGNRPDAFKRTGK